MTNFFYSFVRSSMNIVSPAFRFILVLLVCSSSSCFGVTDYAKEVRVIFEICRSKYSIEEVVTLGYQAISKSGYGGIWLDPRRKTNFNEPVYYADGERESNHIAMVALFSDSKEERFVFLRPKNEYLKFDSWSPWLSPDSVTDDERVEGKILRNIDFNKSNLAHSLVFIRYRLMSFGDYLKTIRNRAVPLEVIEGGKCGE
jgi:hypothetical protein